MMETKKEFLLTQFGSPILVSLLYFFDSPSIFLFILFVVGLYLGLAMLWFDSKIFIKYYSPKVSNKEMKSSQESPNSSVQLATRSFLFLLCYVPLSIFVITSSGSNLGKGLILGLGIGLVTEMLWLFRNPEDFNQRFMLQAKKQFSPLEINWLAMGMTVFIVFLIILGLI